MCLVPFPGAWIWAMLEIKVTQELDRGRQSFKCGFLGWSALQYNWSHPTSDMLEESTCHLKSAQHIVIKVWTRLLLEESTTLVERRELLRKTVQRSTREWRCCRSCWLAIKWSSQEVEISIIGEVIWTRLGETKLIRKSRPSTLTSTQVEDLYSV